MKTANDGYAIHILRLESCPVADLADRFYRVKDPACKDDNDVYRDCAARPV